MNDRFCQVFVKILNGTLMPGLKGQARSDVKPVDSAQDAIRFGRASRLDR